MPSTLSQDHRSVSGFLTMSVTRNTPTGVPMRLSVDRMSKPRYRPVSHWSSNLPGFNFVLGILKQTFSPNSAMVEWLCLPFIMVMDVWPFSRTRHLEMRHAAWRTIHGTTGLLRWILCFSLISNAALRVRT